MATVSGPTQVRRAPNVTANANPYQTPASTRSDRKTVSKATSVPALHSDRAIGVASFLGGVIAGAILLARNNFLLGRITDGIMCLAVSVVWQAFVIFVALSLPFALPGGISMGIVFGQAHLMQLIAKQSFAEQYAAIAAGRGQWGHWGWPLLAISIQLVTIFSLLVFVSGLFN